jgi:hypothetical protein
MDERLRIARIAQSVTPVTVIYLTISTQSRVATLHLVVHELLAVLVVPVVIAMPAPHGPGGAECREPGVTVAHRTRQVLRVGLPEAWRIPTNIVTHCVTARAVISHYKQQEKFPLPA